MLPILGGGVVVLVLGGAIFWLGSGAGAGGGPRQAEFAGRTTSEWLEAVRKRGLDSRFGGYTAYEALRDMPPDEAAIPALIAAAEDEHPIVRDKAGELLGRFFKVKLSKGAVEALVPGLDGGVRTRDLASGLLMAQGAGAEPARAKAIAMVGSAESKKVVVGLNLLSKIGLRDPGPVVPLLDSPDDEVRFRALEAMASEPSNAATILPRLLPMLDGKAQEKGQALLALARLGPAAEPALPRLVTFWRANRNFDLGGGTRQVAGAILAIGPSAVDAARQIVADGMAGDCDDLIVAIAKRGPAGEPFVPALLDALGSAEEPPRNEALRAIEAIGPAAAATAGPRLREAIGRPDLYSRSLLWNSLGALGLTTGLTNPELELFLPPAGMASHCWTAVATMAAGRGAAARGLIPALERAKRQALQEKANDEFRRSAAGSQRHFRSGVDVTDEVRRSLTEMYNREIGRHDEIIATIDGAIAQIGPG